MNKHPKPRGDWNGIKPFTRVIPSKKKFDRKKVKKETRSEIGAGCMGR